MAAGEPVNPNKVVAPGSDNTQGTAGGSAVSGAAAAPQVVFDKDLTKGIEAQIKLQEKQTKELQDIADALKENEKSLSEAQKRAEIAKFQGDSKAFDLAEKDIAVAKAFKDENNKKLNDVGDRIFGLQDKLDKDLSALASIYDVSLSVAKQHLDVSDTGSKAVEGVLNDLTKAEKDANKSFSAALDTFLVEETGKEKASSERAERLNKLVEQGNKFTESLDVEGLSKATNLNLNTMSVIQDTIKGMVDGISDEGFDKSDPEAVKRETARLANDKETRKAIIEKLVEQRDSIDKQTVVEELQKQYMMKTGMTENIARAMAERNSKEEIRKRKEEFNQQIKVFKNLEGAAVTGVALQEESIRQKDQEAKQRKQDPLFEIKKRFDLQLAMLDDFIEVWKSGGWIKKVFLVLLFISGAIAGLAVSIFNKIKNIFMGTKWLAPILNEFKFISNIFAKTGGFFSTIFGKLQPVFNVLKTVFVFADRLMGITKFIQPFIGALQIGFKFGSLLGRLFYPLTIVLTVIDAVIGAFKGFKKDGLMGIGAGILAQIVSSLTLGFVKFDFLYKLFKKVTDILLIPTRLIFSQLKFVWESIMGLWDFVKDIFSGVGIKAAVMKFWNKMTEAIKNALFRIYDITIGSILRLFGFGEKEGKKQQKDGEGILSKVFNILKYMNPLYWIYKGVEAVIKLAMNLYEKIKGFLPDLLAKIMKRVGQIVVGLLDIVGFPIKVLAHYYNEAFKLVSSIISKVFDVIKSIVMIPLNFMKELFTTINNMVTRVMKIVQGIMMIPVNFMLRLQKAVLAFVDYLLSFLPDFIAKYFRPVDTLIDVNGGGGKGKEAEKSLAAEQKSRDEAAASSASKSSTNVSTNTTVNNVRGGAEGQMTVIAPQPPRNTEPTLRTMQFSEQPAF